MSGSLRPDSGYRVSEVSIDAGAGVDAGDIDVTRGFDGGDPAQESVGGERDDQSAARCWEDCVEQADSSGEATNCLVALPHPHEHRSIVLDTLRKELGDTSAYVFTHMELSCSA
ncbi:hypothetical protein [Nocardia sp. NPDC004860]|uniref:hypothetical protein n=1 Tax=Nocardia sp. NPDC004860 TaxID=3154557 RepID=UPI0033B84AC1